MTSSAAAAAVAVSSSSSSTIIIPKWQADLGDVSDPSDWLGGRLTFLKNLDASLRCEICSDILRAPVAIKTCHHVFCSRCIRDYINQPTAIGNPTERPCPNCRQPKVYDSELVPVAHLEVAAEAWRAARPQLVRTESELAELLRERTETASASSGKNGSSNKKRRLLLSSADEVGSTSSSSSSPIRSRVDPGQGQAGPRRVTRSTTGAGGASPGGSRKHSGEDSEEAIVLDDDDDDDNSDKQRLGKPIGENGKDASRRSPVKIDGNSSSEKDHQDVQPTDIVECPMCGYTFTYAALNRHLDTANACKGPDQPPPSDRERGLAIVKGNSSSSNNKSGGGALGTFFGQKGKSNSTGHGRPTSPSSTAGKPHEVATKLKRPQYRLLSERELRKQCQECGLATTGSKSHLESRHRHWIDLYNANTDASPHFRRSEIALRRELREWEREREREEVRLIKMANLTSKNNARGTGGSFSVSASSSNGSAVGNANGTSTSTSTGGVVIVGASEEERRRYAALNREQFKLLEEQGRKSHRANKVVHAQGSASQEEEEQRKGIRMQRHEYDDDDEGEKREQSRAEKVSDEGDPDGKKKNVDREEVAGAVDVASSAGSREEEVILIPSF